MKEKNRFVKFLPLVAGLVVFLMFGDVALGGWKTVPNPNYNPMGGDPNMWKSYYDPWDPPPGRIIPVSPSIGNVTQRIFPSTVPPGGTLKITLIPSPTCRFDYPDYRVTERIPAGFTFISTTAYNATVNGNVVSLRQRGGSSIIYTLKASSITGTYTIKGTFMDDRWDMGSVRGTTSIRVDYDTKGNGRIDISKVFLAVMDNFNGLIGKHETFCKVSDWKRKIFLQLN